MNELKTEIIPLAGDKSKPESYYMCRDTATGEDSLGFQPYVEAIAEFLTSEGTLAPITLSIEGQWGCGKSSFMQQLRKKISKKNGLGEKTKYFTVWFNSWKYDKEDELWASFALNFMDELSKQLSWKRLQHSRLKLFYLRYKLKLTSNFLIIVHFSWSILSFVLIFSFSFLFITYILNYLGMPLPGFIDDKLIKNLTNLVLILTPLVGFMHYFSTEKWFIDVFSDPFGLKKLESNKNYKERLSFREHFHSDFNEIIKSYVGNSKVYVFIDDLDRCEVPKAAELMQAINLMISDDSKVYFILGMDRKVISAGLAAKNEKVLRFLDVDGLEYGYEFIEKFIQLPFKVPRPKNIDFLKLLASPYEKESPSKQLEAVDKSDLSDDSTPSESPERDIKSSQNETGGQKPVINDSSTVVPELNKQEIQNDTDCVEDFETSKLILEMVAPALDNNPRRIKQFINQFRFQRTIGKRTGLFCYDVGTNPGNMWNCKKLAKFVAISIKWPSLVSALGSNSKLLDQLQYVSMSELMPEDNNENLEKWTRDKRLINLLRYGCQGNDPLKKPEDFILSGLDFSKLLQISPVFAPPEEGTELPSVIFDGIEFVQIPAGYFIMGSPEDEVGRYGSESPQHTVNIKNPFYLGKYPVTQKQWEKVMGSNPSFFKGDDLPVESVSWDDVQEFIKKLNEIKGIDKYSLPSEAEWEYACRAGTTTMYFFGDDESKLWNYAWHGDYSAEERYKNKNKILKKGTHPVGRKLPNSFGIYDMHGNVCEWVQDRWHSNYNGAPSDGSAWEDGDSSDRVLRGGSWSDLARICRSANRHWQAPRNRLNYVGFRLLRKL